MNEQKSLSYLPFAISVKQALLEPGCDVDIQINLFPENKKNPTCSYKAKVRKSIKRYDQNARNCHGMWFKQMAFYSQSVKFPITISHENSENLMHGRQKVRKSNHDELREE